MTASVISKMSHAFLQVTKPSSTCSNYDGSKGENKVTLLQSAKVCVGRGSGWMDESPKHQRDAVRVPFPSNSQCCCFLKHDMSEGIFGIDLSNYFGEYNVTVTNITDGRSYRNKIHNAINRSRQEGPVFRSSQQKPFNIFILTFITFIYFSIKILPESFPFIKCVQALILPSYTDRT